MQFGQRGFARGVETVDGHHRQALSPAHQISDELIGAGSCGSWTRRCQEIGGRDVLQRVAGRDDDRCPVRGEGGWSGKPLVGVQVPLEALGHGLQIDDVNLRPAGIRWDYDRSNPAVRRDRTVVSAKIGAQAALLARGHIQQAE